MASCAVPPGRRPGADDASLPHAEVLGPLQARRVGRAVAHPRVAGDQAGAGDVVEQEVQRRGRLALTRKHMVDGGAEVATALVADQSLDAGPLGHGLDRLHAALGADGRQHLRRRHDDGLAGGRGHQVTGPTDQVERRAEPVGPHHVDRRRAADRSRPPRWRSGLGVVQRLGQWPGRAHLGLGHPASLRRTAVSASGRVTGSGLVQRSLVFRRRGHLVQAATCTRPEAGILVGRG